MSASAHCGSRRVQLVIDAVVGAPEKVGLPPGGTTIGGGGWTANVVEISPVVPNVSMARIVSVWSLPGVVGGSGRTIRNCDQLKLSLTAFANSPPSTLYCTTTIGACGLVADPLNAKFSGSSAAMIGDANGVRLIVGVIAGTSRTTKVVLTFSVARSGSLGV